MDDKAGIAVIVDALDDVLCEGGTVVELTEGDEAGMHGDLAAIEVEADGPVIAEGESAFDVALCLHGGSPPETAFWLATTLFQRSYPLKSSEPVHRSG